jgi:hypothetical protein
MQHRRHDSIFSLVSMSPSNPERNTQTRSGISINKALRPLRSATVTIGTQQVTAQPRLPAETQTLLTTLGWSGH